MAMMLVAGVFPSGPDQLGFPEVGQASWRNSRCSSSES